MYEFEYKYMNKINYEISNLLQLNKKYINSN